MSYTKIAGMSAATAEQMIEYIKSKNSAVAKSVIDMIPLYISEGKAEGIRGDVAFAQSCLETGNFTFKGSAVTLSQNNFCGMGVTYGGSKGNSFSTPQIGIRAQIQHLKAYADNESLVNACVDPRFKYVARGCAKYVEWLGIRENPNKKGWASGSKYGPKILAILNGILSVTVTSPANAGLYRVRKSWNDSGSQVGAYSVLSNAKACCDKHAGYFVFASNGVCIYPLPYMITASGSFGYYTAADGKKKAGNAAKGKYTIVEVDESYTYGKLKSGAGWVPLFGFAVSSA